MAESVAHQHVARAGATGRRRRVFKDGKGYDPKKLIDSVKGMVGSR